MFKNCPLTNKQFIFIYFNWFLCKTSARFPGEIDRGD